MLAHVVLPIVDPRVFLSQRGGKLARPAFPLVSPGQDFIRATGAVRPRLLGGTFYWTGDQHYCDASKALRFGAAGGMGFVAPPWRVAFRRLVDTNHEWPVVSFEVGFAARTGPSAVSPLDLLECPVRIGEAERGVALRDATGELAAHYGRATTTHGIELADEASPQAARPLLVVEGEPTETEELVEQLAGAPRMGLWLEQPFEYGGVTARFGPRPSGPRDAGIFLVTGEPDTGRRRRNVRLYLIRIYCTAVALFHLHGLMRAGAVGREWRTAEGQLLQGFLDDARRVLSRGTPLDVEPDELLARLVEWARLASAGDYDDLIELTRGIRPNLQRNLEDLLRGAQQVTIEEMVLVEGDQHSYRSGGDMNVVQGNVSGSAIGREATNVVEGDVNQVITQVRGDVDRLTQVVAQLPDDAQQMLAPLVDDLRAEVGKNAPDGRATRSLLERIADRARAIGEIAKPVLEVAAGILKLLPAA